MKLNENVKIIGQRVILIPYEEIHVPQYHTWMQSKELQKLTASEPLTLEQEYEMQQTWRNDEDKCTFLVMDKARFDCTGDEIGSLIGDTNIFFQKNCDTDTLVAEAEIMIAERNHRRKGFGWEAMLLMLRYCTENFKIEKFIAKIGNYNTGSISMFSKMGFTKVSQSEVFQEVTMESCVTDTWRNWLRHETQVYELTTYADTNTTIRSVSNPLALKLCFLTI